MVIIFSSCCPVLPSLAAFLVTFGVFFVVIEMVFLELLLICVILCMLESLFVLERVEDLDLMLMELRLPISLLRLPRDGDLAAPEAGVCWFIGDPLPTLLLLAPDPGTGEPWIGFREGERGDRRRLRADRDGESQDLSEPRRWLSLLLLLAGDAGETGALNWSQKASAGSRDKSDSSLD